ncbi:flagellar motor switch protein FliN [Alienimonas chondri]|uniref:Flagellar motor switch protein FliN n=1 Tax=Alienimonas chondri TaxID=2681879 RepID=A0ABX1VHR2_9PLAN|nr:flagellar motor switch protein FliN [Alienimonas chondri]NNJ27657.1 hypothetical protein [Alienimonas chondri]
MAASDASPADADPVEDTADAPAPRAGETGETLPSDDIEALLAAAAAGSVEMPPEDDEGTVPDPIDGSVRPAAEAAESPLVGQAAGGGSPDEPIEPHDTAHGQPGPATSIPVGGQVEKLLEEVEAEVRRGRRPVLAAGENPPDALGRTSPLELERFAEGGPLGDAGSSGLGTLDDVELDLRIELGRAEMSLEDVVGLRDGSVVTLDKLAGDPVDILVNGRLVARGEVLVLNDNFCVRVAEILAPDR